MVSVPMALVDYIPVVLYCISAVILQRYFYDRMSRGAFALLSAGMIMSIMAGLFKATWKLLFALEVCDFDRLNKSFFPLQSVGFLLAGIALMLMVFTRQKGTSLHSAAPAVFAGTGVFIALMVLGLCGMFLGLSVEAKRRKKKSAMVLFIITFVFMLMMGYLSSKNFEKASMNWISEGVNVMGWSIFLMGSRILSGAGKEKESI
jgi:hypothetical protein